MLIIQLHKFLFLFLWQVFVKELCHTTWLRINGVHMYKEIFVIETFSYHGDEISDIVDTFNMVDGIFHHFTGLFTSLCGQ